LNGGLSYLAGIGHEELDVSQLEIASGVGVVVSREDIRCVIEEILSNEQEVLKSKQYRAPFGKYLAEARQKLPWADGRDLKDIFDQAVQQLLGTRPSAPVAQPAAEILCMDSTTVPSEKESHQDPFRMFPSPQENMQVQTSITYSTGEVHHLSNPREQLMTHLARTHGRVVTRFPPEPNGYLHLGHAKAMFVDFGYAQEKNGACYLRFDDTNPTEEKQEYINHIKEIVNWLGWHPARTTYSSDYFSELYILALELIRRDKAYVDHQTPEEIKMSREKHSNSPWRNRPIHESLAVFEEMRRGLWEEGSATLRMKQDMRNENFNMFDLIAYRIKFAPHPRAGDQWVIYPSYDYTHCIVDSMENITHSLCTLEFETRRASYFWLLDALSLYLPHVWEYSRLNVSNNVLSKRKLNKLVTGNYVNGWDDPRLLTLAGLRRRGASPNAINKFVKTIGITRNFMTVNHGLLNSIIREDLNASAPRAMAVLRPLKVIVTNFPFGTPEILKAVRFPQRGLDSPTYDVYFGPVLYIEQSDFRVVDSKDYYGLAPGKTVMLRYAYPVKCVGYETAQNGEVTEISVQCDFKKASKPKGVLHWVSSTPETNLLQLQVRLYGPLFHAEDPNTTEDYLSDLDPKSVEVVTGAVAPDHLAKNEVGHVFQLERLGYFTIDPDSTPSAPVLTRTVTLRDAFHTNKAKC